MSRIGQEINSESAKRLKLVMERQHMSGEQLCKKINNLYGDGRGCTPKHLSAILNGHAPVTRPMAAKFADALSSDIDFLMGLKDFESTPETLAGQLRESIFSASAGAMLLSWLDDQGIRILTIESKMKGVTPPASEKDKEVVLYRIAQYAKRKHLSEHGLHFDDINFYETLLSNVTIKLSWLSLLPCEEKQISMNGLDFARLYSRIYEYVSTQTAYTLSTYQAAVDKEKLLDRCKDMDLSKHSADVLAEMIRDSGSRM